MRCTRIAASRPTALRDAARVALDDGCRARRLLDEVGARRAPADGLEAERPEPGVEVEHGGAAEGVGGLEGAEERLAHPVARRPGAGVGNLERERSGAPGDDACHTLTIAAGGQAAVGDGSSSRRRGSVRSSGRSPDLSA